MRELTAETLRELLSYDPITGEFRWRVTKSAQAKIGTIAGCESHGYRQIGIFRKPYKSARLAWLYVYGEWPKHDIDHINGIRDDNRISNLRDVTRLVNCQNRRIAKSGSWAGLLGVSKNKKRWSAKIRAGGRQICIGTFDTPEQAHEAYILAKRELHPGCTL